MSECSLLRYCYLAYFSKPVGDRALYRALRKRRFQSVVELGIGLGVRTQRMFELIRPANADVPLRYTGIDLFEARAVAGTGFRLKQAYQTLHQLPGKIQLVPGDPYGALSRVANTLTGTDLLVISADQDAESLARAWFYVPRMLTPNALVLIERTVADGKTHYETLTVEKITELAAAQAKAARRVA